MEESVRAPLAAWESFYVIVGSSGAALTGLQFVVMALAAESRRRSSLREIDAFGTPTIVHFCAVLLIAAILSAPWQALTSVSLALGACGLVGTIYGIIVVRRARAQTGYEPVLEDWLWHAVLPLVSYVFLLVSAVVLRSLPQKTLFVIGAVAILLLFIGIHNAWDTVTYIAIAQKETRDELKQEEHGEESAAS
jgi:lipid-A-disaccharide synthase-like uncharacterized protein